jgi:hypothetical protein
MVKCSLAVYLVIKNGERFVTLLLAIEGYWKLLVMVGITSLLILWIGDAYGDLGEVILLSRI